MGRIANTRALWFAVIIAFTFCNVTLQEQLEPSVEEIIRDQMSESLNGFYAKLEEKVESIIQGEIAELTVDIKQIETEILSKLQTIKYSLNSSAITIEDIHEYQKLCPTVSTCPSCPTTTGAPSTTQIPSTTTELTTTEAITTPRVPAGFEDFHGRVIRRTVPADTKYRNWADAMRFCSAQFGAGSQPFIPQTTADYDLYKQVRATLTNGGYMWLPASDSLVEGTLRWVTDGQVATNLHLWDWYKGQVLRSNSESSNCLFYGLSDGPKVHMIECSTLTSYPPICEIV